MGLGLAHRAFDQSNAMPGEVTVTEKNYSVDIVYQNYFPAYNLI